MSAPDRYVLPETTLLAIIGSLDLLSTVYLIATHRAYEANPLMAGVLHRYGPGGFIFLKFLLMAVPLTIAELARKQHPAFARMALRVGILLYIGIYAISFARCNLAAPGGE